MIINNSCQFIFVHVPKAAGSSLANHLSTFSRYCDLEVGGTVLGEALQPEFRRRYRLSKHSSVMEIREIAGDALWKQYFSFGFVRNPYDRAFSIFNFLKKMSKEQPEAYGEIEKYSTFAEFILSDFYQTEGPDRIFNPQLFWLRDNASGDQIGVDFVGRVEEIDTCMNELSQKIGRGKENFSWAQVPRLNTSGDGKRTAWDEFQDNRKLAEIIFRRNSVDFRAFGYGREVMPGKDQILHSGGLPTALDLASPAGSVHTNPPRSRDVLLVCGCRHSGTSAITKWLVSSGMVALGIERYQRYWSEHLSLPTDAFSEGRFFEGRSGDTRDDTLSQDQEHYAALHEKWRQAVLVGDEIPELWRKLEWIFSAYPGGKVVYTFRDPFSVASSHKVRSKNLFSSESLKYAALEWNESALKVLEYFNSDASQSHGIHERCFVIQYEEFVNNSGDRHGLTRFLGGKIALPDIQIDSHRESLNASEVLDEMEREVVRTHIDKRISVEMERILDKQKVYFSRDANKRQGRLQWYHASDKRDADIEYGEYQISGCSYVFRGRSETPRQDSPYVACIGSATTFGRFLRNPYPAQLERFTGTPFVNLGVGGGRPESFLANEALTKVLQKSSLVIMEVMSARGCVSPIFEPLDSVTNLGHFKDYFGLEKFAEDDAGLQMLLRKAKDKEPVFVDRVYENTFKYLTSPQRDLVRDALISRYSRDSSFLVEMIGKQVIALFMSRKAPCEAPGQKSAESYEQWSGGFPHFVDDAFLELFHQRGIPVVVSRSQRGFPFVVKNWVTDEPSPVFSWQQDPALNTYYPSQEMHDDAFQALIQLPLIGALCTHAH